MTALQLYKFINKNSVAIDWREEELVIWIPFIHLEEFVNLLGSSYLSDGGTDINLQNNCVALDIVPLCEYFDIEPNEILEHEE